MIKDEQISEIIDDWDDFDELEVGDTFPCPDCKSTKYEELYVTPSDDIIGCSECVKNNESH